MTSPRTHPAVAIRVGLLAALPVAEFLSISFGVDAVSLREVDAAWAQLLAHAGQATRFALGFGAAFVIAAWPRIPAHWSRLLEQARDHAWLPRALAQLASFALFAWLTRMLFVAADAQVAYGGALALAWLAVALLALLLAVLGIAPRAFWIDALRREVPALALSALAGGIAWFVARGTQDLWGPLAEGTFHIAAAVLALIYPSGEIVADAGRHVLGTAHFKVDIAPACSGYEGIGLVVAFLTLYLSVFRRELRFPRALLLYPLGIATIWLFNAVRIALLVAIGSSWSPEIAVGGFHSQAGWIAFIVVVLGLIWLIDRSPFFAREGARQRAQGAQGAQGAPASPLVRAMLVPFVVLLAATLAESVLAHDFAWLYPLRVLATGAALAWFAQHYALRAWRPAFAPVVAGVAAYLGWRLLVPPDAAGDAAFAAELGAVSTATAAAWLAARALGSVLVVPLAEELAFRGYLLARLCGRAPSMDERLPLRWLAIGLSALAFGLLHGAWLAGTVAGLVYAWVRYRRGQVLDAVLAHLVTNACVTIDVLLTGQWVYW